MSRPAPKPKAGRLAGAGLLLAGMLPLLVSCVAAPPRRGVATPFTVPSQWSGGAASPGPVGAAWWESFGSPGLIEAVNEALQNNLDLHAAAARLEAAAAEARVAGAALWPTLGASFNAQRQQQNFIGLPIPGARGGVLTARFNSFGVGLNTSWELDLWGRVRAGKRAALAEVQASEASLAALRQSIAAQTAKAWLAALEAQRQVDLSRRTVRSYELTARQTRARYARGLRSALELRLASNTLASAQAVLHQREAARQRAVRQLEILLGRYPAGRLDTEADFPKLPGEVPAGLPSDLLQRRPDVLAAERRLAAADARLWQAKASLFPRLSLTASGGTSSSDLSDLVSSQFKVWTLAGNLAQPLFEGGRLRAGVALADARARQAVADYLQTALTAFAEVESALASEQFLAERERSLAEAAAQAQAALRLANDRYARGLESFLSVLESQRRAFDAESQLLAARRLRADNRVDLHLALGGAFAAASARADVPSVSMAGDAPLHRR